ncbi:hypothetical protein CCUS01_14787 [Colletotrichum cuscutae]|uniref:Uncharacterized protein n=1 Tax=Colletotrichum cuscutae TaxID=1209917 RepID=A0AAI9VHG1_9PEZI|nr:hypothetical protein CCUS01_14787 [Colletotrichum cuscutae]
MESRLGDLLWGRQVLRRSSNHRPRFTSTWQLIQVPYSILDHTTKSQACQGMLEESLAILEIQPDSCDKYLKPSQPPTAKAAPTKTYSLRPCHSCTRGGRPVAWYSRLETTLPAQQKATEMSFWRMDASAKNDTGNH